MNYVTQVRKLTLTLSCLMLTEDKLVTQEKQSVWGNTPPTLQTPGKTAPSPVRAGSASPLLGLPPARTTHAWSPFLLGPLTPPPPPAQHPPWHASLLSHQEISPSKTLARKTNVKNTTSTRRAENPKIQNKSFHLWKHEF